VEKILLDPTKCSDLCEGKSKKIDKTDKEATMKNSYENCRHFHRWIDIYNQQQDAVYSNNYRQNLNLLKDTVTYDFIDEPDLENYRYSNEVPTNKEFYEMGLCQYKNAILEQDQTGRYLRECCIQRAGSNHFLHKKTLGDLRSQHQHLDPEALMVIFVKIAQKEDIEGGELPYDIAYKWAQANRALKFDRKQFVKIIHTEMKYMDTINRIAFIEELEEIANDLDRPEITVKWTNYLNSADVEREYLSQYMNILSYFVEDEESWQYWDEIIEPVQTQLGADGTDKKDNTNPYSTNKLYNGTEMLSWNFQQKIANADMDEIIKLQSKMFPQKRSFKEMMEIMNHFEEKYGTLPAVKSSNPRKKPLWKSCKKNPNSVLFKYKKPVLYDDGQPVMISAVSTGLVYKPPEFSYFTPEMKSHFWLLVKLRKKELNEKVEHPDKWSQDTAVAINWIKKLGKGQTTCNIIKNATEGIDVNMYGIKITFQHPLSRKEINTLWQTYKSI
jgi:hypothetical protein